MSGFPQIYSLQHIGNFPARNLLSIFLVQIQNCPHSTCLDAIESYDGERSGWCGRDLLALGDIKTPSGDAGAESLTSQIYARLRAEILQGRIRPDQKLKVEQLRTVLGVGSSPIREALSLLTSDRLVERLDNRGFRVSPATLADFDDIQTARCWIEERALREAIARNDHAWEEEVLLAQHRLTRLERTLVDGDRTVSNPAWEAAHKRFHMVLLSACRSPTVLQICEQLYDLNTRYRNLAVIVAGPRDWKAEHTGIAEAVIARDVDLAAQRLIKHYRTTGAILRLKL